jgi:hypothetical protein
MNLQDLAGLTTEQKFVKAAEYAGVPVEVLDRQWATESSRGKNLRGPDTKWGVAKGHFQFLDSTAASIEARKGYKLDRDSLDGSLVLAAELWKENMAASGGDVATAAAMYHGGPNRKQWGPKTADYVRKLTALDLPSPQGDVAAPVPATTNADTVAAAMRLSAGMTEQNINRGASDVDALLDQTRRSADHAKREQTGFGEVFKTALDDPRVMTWGLLDWALNQSEPIPKGWSYAAVADEAEAGLTEDEIELVREAGPKGPDAVMRARAQVQEGWLAHHAWWAACRWRPRPRIVGRGLRRLQGGDGREDRFGCPHPSWPSWRGYGLHDRRERDR